MTNLMNNFSEEKIQNIIKSYKKKSVREKYNYDKLKEIASRSEQDSFER